MKSIFWIIVIMVCIYFFLANSCKDPATDPDMILEDSNAEAQRQEIIANHSEGTPLSEEESHVVYKREYERADKTSIFILIIFSMLLGSTSLVFFCPSNPLNLIISLSCCVVLIICGQYKWIILALLLNCIIFPTLIVMALANFFGKD